MATAPVNPFARTQPTATPAAAPAPATYTPAAQQFPAAPDGAASADIGDDPFGAPAPPPAGGPRLRDILMANPGARPLVAIRPVLLEEVPNTNENARTSTQLRMTGDIVVLDGNPIPWGGQPEKINGRPHDKSASVGELFESVFISSTGIISQSRDTLGAVDPRVGLALAGAPGVRGRGIGRWVLGRLYTGEAKGTQQPPFLLDASSTTDADRTLARQWFAAYQARQSAAVGMG
jgi:hypothetical protein